MLIYRISDGVIIAKIPRGQPYDYLHEGEDLGTYEIDYNIDLEKYIIRDNKLVELTEIEKLEIRDYNRILSEEERFEKNMLNKLIPPHEEIAKAETTIEILSLLSEVL